MRPSIASVEVGTWRFVVAEALLRHRRTTGCASLVEVAVFHIILQVDRRAA